MRHSTLTPFLFSSYPCNYKGRVCYAAIEGRQVILGNIYIGTFVANDYVLRKASS